MTTPNSTDEKARKGPQPPQQRSMERSICENKAFAILNKSQAGKTEIVKKDGGEMLVAIALDKPLAKESVENPTRLIS